MSERKTIEGQIAADWWMLAGALDALLFFDEQRQRDRRPDPDPNPDWYPDTPSHTSGPDRDGYHFTLNDPSPHIFGRTVGRINLIRKEGATFVQMLVNPDEPKAYALCWRLYQALGNMVGNAEHWRRQAQPSADEVIERYYRQRAAGGRATLKQIAAETMYSYDYLRKVKRAYDAAGKWGSKKEPKGSL